MASVSVHNLRSIKLKLKLAEQKGQAVKIEVLIGNIAKQPGIEAVVNSANGNLRLGSGVAGAIHTAAGRELEEYCQQFAPLPHGQAVITPGFKLPNKWVIHTRAANYLLDENAEDILKQCFESVWRLAKEHSIKSLAFPSIGTGVFKVPLALTASTAAASLKAHEKDTVELVRICVTDTKSQNAFWDALDACEVAYEI
jgi:O-acetyl-ADP-ribose deacetylase (regulator of RNase III)